MLGNGFGHGGYALENSAGALGIGDLEPVCFVERYDQLEGVHRIQTEAAGAEQHLLVANLFRRDLQHEVFDHQPLNFLFQCRRIIHHKIAALPTEAACNSISPEASRKPPPTALTAESRQRRSELANGSHA